jgi:hypothetical protein
MNEVVKDRPFGHLPSAFNANAERKTKAPIMTTNDRVDVVYLLLRNDSKFASLLDGTINSESVNGAIIDDDVKAAEMIIEKAKELDDNVLASKNTATVRHALGIVLNRYGESRKARRNRLHGEQVKENGYSEGNDGE